MTGRNIVIGGMSGGSTHVGLVTQGYGGARASETDLEQDPNPENGYHRINRIVATLYDGRTVAKGVTAYPCLGATIYVEITIPNLNFIEEILNVQIYTEPETGCPTWGNKNIIDNVIGITICDLANGITATIEIIAIGV